MFFNTQRKWSSDSLLVRLIHNIRIPENNKIKYLEVLIPYCSHKSANKRKGCKVYGMVDKIN